MKNWILRSILLAALLAPLLVQAAAPAQLAGAKTSPPAPLLLLPATGYWLDAERPGTGFALERRGNVLALVFYHFSDVAGQATRAADWHLASGLLQGDTFEARLLHFDGGSCLGCDPFAEADAEQTETVVRLVFASAREATLQVDGGEPRRVVAMPYGVAYEAAVATPADLPLPDLRGRWLVEGLSEHGVITLVDRIVTEDGVEYRGQASELGFPNASAVCNAQGCILWLDALPDLSPAARAVAQFNIGDITEERMTGRDELTFPVRAFRVFDGEGRP